MLGFCLACIRRNKVDPKHKIKRASEYHHKFSRTKWALKLYGKKLINDPRNLEPACNGCNASHASPYLTHWDESKFCQIMDIEPKGKMLTRAKNQ